MRSRIGCSARLSENRIVIITVGAEAHKFTEVPFF
jgi:hypothetical protein